MFTSDVALRRGSCLEDRFPKWLDRFPLGPTAACQYLLTAEGVVKIWKMEEGRGVIASPELPPGHGTWVRFSDILARDTERWRSAAAWSFEVVQRRQDGFTFVATDVRKV
ncbi:hypothetical protein [Nonomuraea sp. NPDC049400]|uniref:hypothetical protein n=1 Tax=Nonomuraea sp. NPDC049400 TaxID=3364352 RepID=UPI00378A78C5